MSFGGTCALVMIPALSLIMSDLCKTFSLSACFLIYKMEIIHLPCGIAMTASSQETELLRHMQLMKRAEGQFLPPPLASILWAEEGTGTLKENTLPVFVSLRHQIVVHLTSLRGITNILIITGQGFSPTFRLFFKRAHFDAFPQNLF